MVGEAKPTLRNDVGRVLYMVASRFVSRSEHVSADDEQCGEAQTVILGACLVARLERIDGMVRSAAAFLAPG